MPELPFILAGPIVRRVEPRTCSFWIALRESKTVTIHLWKGQRQHAADTSDAIASGGATTRKFGPKLHIAVITVTLSTQAQNLEPRQMYSYDVSWDISGATRKSLDSEKLLEDQAAAGDDPGHKALGYVSKRLPAFITPAATLDQLRLAHGSCRKTNGPGFDALAWLDDHIAAHKDDLAERPQQLFLTGDQIYADDVAGCLLPMLNEIGRELVGEETLPVDSTMVNCTIQNFPALRRQKLVRAGAGFTSTDAHSHLLGFGEYAAMYLAAWGPHLWRALAPLTQLRADLSSVPADLKDNLTDWEACKETDNAFAEASIEEHRKRIIVYRNAVPKVARALANTVTYMICDDHEVTDDWNLNQRWRNRVYSKPLGRALVRNGVMAYGIFQGWGNNPAAFDSGNNKDFLDKTVEMAAALVTPPQAVVQRLEELIGASGADATRQAIWHYTVPGPKHLVAVMDSRTRRKYRGQGEFPASLLGDSLNDQIPAAPLAESRELLIVVAPAPVLGPDLIVHIAAPILQVVKGIQNGNKKGESSDPCTPGMIESGGEKYDAEGWADNEQAQEALLKRCAEHPKVLILSGDVHYADSLTLDYWRKANLTTPSRIVQLTASPLRNDFKPLVQALIRSNALLQEFARGLPPERLGWNGPAQITIPAGEPVALGRRAKMKRSPALLSARGWPVGAVFVAGKEPDWRWRLNLVRDERPNAALPEELRQPALIPAADINLTLPNKYVNELGRVAARQFEAAMDHFDQLRQMVFNTNIGLVSFSGSGTTLKVKHTLMAQNGKTGPDQVDENVSAPVTVHDIPFTTPADAQPPAVSR